MIEFEQFTLDNGLRVILCPDQATQMVTVNLMYDVGARDESPERTGFAHLFEHLMFGGTPGIPDYDNYVEKAGGQNNAFTSNDLTNYYISLPSANLETALWLEADRMAGLAFTEKSLDVQRKVVVEEFKQRYLNQPYGDVYLLMRPLAFKKHPYQWPTIGKNIQHVEEASMQEVKDFFYAHYAPANAVLCLSGGFNSESAKALVEHYFGPIPPRDPKPRFLPEEPKQDSQRRMRVERDVPVSVLYMAFHMGGRLDPDYPATDLLSDVLGNGESSRLHKDLVQEKPLFSSISAYVGGDRDPGLFYIAGKLNDGVDFETAEAGIWELISNLQTQGVSEDELKKVKNKYLTNFLFSQVKGLSKAINLCYYSLLGDPNLLNETQVWYERVSPQDVQNMAAEILRAENVSVLEYAKK